MDFTKEDLLREVTFKTSRSGGKGGQNVNKVSSKVELNLDIRTSALFSEEQKALLLERLSNKINSKGILQIITEEDRSQLVNKEISLGKLEEVLKKALYLPKIRKSTKPGRAVKEKRLQLKQANALKKINRNRNLWD